MSDCEQEERKKKKKTVWWTCERAHWAPVTGVWAIGSSSLFYIVRVSWYCWRITHRTRHHFSCSSPKRIHNTRCIHYGIILSSTHSSNHSYRYLYIHVVCVFCFILGKNMSTFLKKIIMASEEGRKTIDRPARIRPYTIVLCIFLIIDFHVIIDIDNFDVRRQIDAHWTVSGVLCKRCGAQWHCVISNPGILNQLQNSSILSICKNSRAKINGLLCLFCVWVSFFVCEAILQRIASIDAQWISNSISNRSIA